MINIWYVNDLVLFWMSSPFTLHHYETNEKLCWKTKMSIFLVKSNFFAEIFKNAVTFDLFERNTYKWTYSRSIFNALQRFCDDLAVKWKGEELEEGIWRKTWNENALLGNLQLSRSDISKTVGYFKNMCRSKFVANLISFHFYL
jgi:hypothetical protein